MGCLRAYSMVLFGCIDIGKTRNVFKINCFCFYAIKQCAHSMLTLLKQGMYARQDRSAIDAAKGL